QWVVNLRDRLEQGLVEEVEGPEYLLLYRRLFQAQLAGQPEQLDLEADLPLQLSALSRSPARRLQFHQEAVDPAVLLQNGDALRFGGVSGQHGPDPEGAESFLKLFSFHARACPLSAALHHPAPHPFVASLPSD